MRRHPDGGLEYPELVAGPAQYPARLRIGLQNARSICGREAELQSLVEGYGLDILGLPVGLSLNVACYPSNLCTMGKLSLCTPSRPAGHTKHGLLLRRTGDEDRQGAKWCWC